MTSKIIMKSWREGMEKISLTKLQMDLLKTPLKRAKTNVDLLLNGEEVILKTEDKNLAEQFSIKANNLGVDCILL